jgi:hypothetical protein
LISSADIEAIRASIAKSHNVLLEERDPIFIAVQLNQWVVAKLLAELKAVSTADRNESIAAVSHQVDVAKAAAAKLINETAQFVASEIRTQVSLAIDASLVSTKQASRASQRASLVALGAAAAALVAAGAIAGSLIAMVMKH